MAKEKRDFCSIIFTQSGGSVVKKPIITLIKTVESVKPKPKPALWKEPKTTLIHWLYEIPFGVYMYTLWLYISGKLMEIIEIDPNLIILILGFNHIVVLLILLLFSDVQKGAKDLGLNIDEKDLNEITKSLNNLKSSLIQEFNNLKFWAKNNKWKIIYSIIWLILWLVGWSILLSLIYMVLFGGERVYAMDDETNKRHPGKRKRKDPEEYNTQPKPPGSTNSWWERIKRWSSPAYKERENQDRQQPKPPGSTSWTKPKPAQLGWWERIKCWASPEYKLRKENEAKKRKKRRKEAKRQYFRDKDSNFQKRRVQEAELREAELRDPQQRREQLGRDRRLYKKSQKDKMERALKKRREELNLVKEVGESSSSYLKKEFPNRMRREFEQLNRSFLETQKTLKEALRDYKYYTREYLEIAMNLIALSKIAYETPSEEVNVATVTNLLSYEVLNANFEVKKKKMQEVMFNLRVSELVANEVCLKFITFENEIRNTHSGKGNTDRDRDRDRDFGLPIGTPLDLEPLLDLDEQSIVGHVNDIQDGSDASFSGFATKLNRTPKYDYKVYSALLEKYKRRDDDPAIPYSLAKQTIFNAAVKNLPRNYPDTTLVDIWRIEAEFLGELQKFKLAYYSNNSLLMDYLKEKEKETQGDRGITDIDGLIKRVGPKMKLCYWYQPLRIILQ